MGGGPPYYCFNPACKHVQQFGECVRYKTPCPTGPARGRGGRRGGPPRGGPYGRGYGPPAMFESPYGRRQMYDPYGPPMYEPYNDYGPPMQDPYFSGGGGQEEPPFLCFSPSCKHVQQFGECVRYKSPCPNRDAGGYGGKFRGRGRGRGRARGKIFFFKKL